MSDLEKREMREEFRKGTDGVNALKNGNFTISPFFKGGLRGIRVVCFGMLVLILRRNIMINCFDSVLVWKDTEYHKRSEVNE